MAERCAGELAGAAIESEGAPYATDAARLSSEGRIPCVVLGPGDIDLAHTAHERVSLDEVERAVELYAAIARGAVTAFAREPGPRTD